MKRPLLTAGATMLVTLFILLQTDNMLVTVAVAVVSLLPFLIFLLKKKKKDDLKSLSIATVFGAICFSAVLLIFSMIFSYYPALDMVGDKQQIDATVTEYPTVSGQRVYIPAKVKSEDGKKLKIKLSVSLKAYNSIGNDVKPGDELNFTGTVYKLGAGIRSVEQNYMSKGMVIGAYPTSDISYTEDDSVSITKLIYSKRQQIISLFNEKADSTTAGVAIGTILGDKSYIDDDIYSSFRQAGVAHILAISGLHLSIWVLFFTGLFNMFGVNKRRSSIILILFVLFVMTLTGFSASICRAGIMMIAYLLGFAIGRRSDGLNSLGLACVVLLVISPFSAINVGFLLSVVATFSIFVLANPIMNALQRGIERYISGRVVKYLLNIIACSLAISISVTLFTLPIQIFYFGSASVLSPIANLLYYPTVSPMIICFGIYAFLYFIPGLNIAALYLGKWLCSYCIFVAEKISSLPLTTINVAKENFFVFLCFVVVAYAAIFLALKSRKKLPSLLASIIVLMSFTAFAFYNNSYLWSKAKIIVENVGDGLVVTVEQGSNTALIAYACDDYYADYCVDDGETFDYVLCDESLEGSSLLDLAQSDNVFTVDEDRDIQLGDLSIMVSNGECFISAYGDTICVTNREVSAGSNIIYITNNSSVTYGSDTASLVLYSTAESVPGSDSTADQADMTLIVSYNGNYSLKGENSWATLAKKN